MYILDTNIWVALFNDQDSLHSKATKIFDLMEDEIIITEYIFIETVNVLQMRAGKDVANKFIDVSTNNSQVSMIYSTSSFFNPF